jgi:hypothetical protein
MSGGRGRGIATGSVGQRIEPELWFGAIGNGEVSRRRSETVPPDLAPHQGWIRQSEFTSILPRTVQLGHQYVVTANPIVVSTIATVIAGDYAGATPCPK